MRENIKTIEQKNDCAGQESNINVFFPYYNCGHPERQQEIDLCLKNNIDNDKITKLLVLVDDGSELPFTSEKVVVISLERRPTYKDWITLTKSYRLTGISILCNSDIYFDDSLVHLDAIIGNGKSFLALSRWELFDNKTTLHSNPHWSQDVWGIHCDDELSPEMLKTLDFPMGVPRCDNKVAYLFAVRGWAVKNPCRYLKSIHVHATELRGYQKKLDARILGGVAYVYPGEALNSEAQLAFDVWVIKSAPIKSVNINKSMEKWIKQAETQAHEKPLDATLSVTKTVVKPQHVTTAKTIIKPQPAPAKATTNPEAKPIVCAFKGAVTTQFSVASSFEMLEAVKAGKSVYQYKYLFEVYEHNGYYLFKNIHNFNHYLKCSNTASLKDVVPAGMIPTVLNTFSKQITQRPSDNDDVNFWQYPCATEKQAYDNHANLECSEHVDFDKRTIRVYVPLPWATYVDKKIFPPQYLQSVASVIEDYQALANEHGYRLEVHSVCQHIHWYRIMATANDIGITNVHISHKYSKSDPLKQEQNFDFKLHPWPLLAPNYAIVERRVGMERKSPNQKTLLASFIGAHMSHYRDSNRIKLFEAAKAYNKPTIFVDLGELWHFNKLVYEEQVLNKKVTAEHIEEHDEKTYRYNTILSDSVFSLCPEGSGPNTLRLWESIAVGSIPVLFSDDLSIFHETSVGKRLLSNCILWKSTINNSLFNFLDTIEEQELNQKSKNLIELYEEFCILRCF